jgi:hypothetical protein
VGVHSRPGTKRRDARGQTWKKNKPALEKFRARAISRKGARSRRVRGRPLVLMTHTLTEDNRSFMVHARRPVSQPAKPRAPAQGRCVGAKLATLRLMMKKSNDRKTSASLATQSAPAPNSPACLFSSRDSHRTRTAPSAGSSLVPHVRHERRPRPRRVSLTPPNQG